MAEGVLSDLIAKSLASLAKLALKELSSWRGARKSLKKLENTMMMIQARVRDAESRQEETSGESIKVWLRRLKQVLYQADDLFDEVLTVDRQNRLNERSALAKVGILFSKAGPLSHIDLAKKIKSIRKELDAIKSDIEILGLKVLPPAELQRPLDRLRKKRETASFVRVEDVIGRKNDKEIIVRMLLDPNYDGKRLTVISILGFGGIGKTTLAQLVFNDEEVQNHFNLKKWVCVPEVDDQDAIIRRVYQTLFPDEKDSGRLLLDQIKSGIRQSIDNKKYLLVLDDIWDEERDNWSGLLELLECGHTGSRVIVTTRSAVVANAIGTTKAHNLGLLTKEESWNLFKRCAFGSAQEEGNPNLTQIGMEIVDSCGNVPLAIKVIGSLLFSKDGNQNEWKYVRDHELPKVKMMEGGNLMPMLKLSYDYLSPALKQCFAYCSLFPKDYCFSRAELVRLWMAHGYFEPDRNIGDRHFLELFKRNLFQDPETDGKGNIIRCKMHDLVHDLAQLVAGDEFMLLDKSSKQITDRLVHVNLNISEAPSSMLAAGKLRSLLEIKDGAHLEKLISSFQYLRVLDLAWMENATLPSSIGGLRHLRYLNLTRNNLLKTLPGAITKLDNLQTLNLHGCQILEELPREFAKLSNLRHLVLDYTSRLKDVPSGFGKMTSLQELDRFIVGKSNGIDSVPASNLMGELKIEFYEWRKDAVLEAQRAILKDNHHLTDLSLVFKVQEEGSVDVAEMDEMLKSLHLPQNLENLTLYRHNGVEMPRRWLDRLSKLVSIEIRWCRNCRVIPHLSRLPLLKDFSLEGLEALEYVEDEEDTWAGGSGGRQSGSTARNDYFPSLEILKLKHLEKLKGWTRPLQDGGKPARQLLFPCLSKLEVKDCPELMSMPLATKLKSLDARGTNWKVFESNMTSTNYQEASSSSSLPSTLFTSLEHLLLNQMGDALVFLSIGCTFCHLKTIDLIDCDQLRSLMFESSSIQRVHINGCESFRNISFGDLSLLHSLKLEGVKKLKKLPQGISCLTALKELIIGDCENLTELPEDMGNLSLLSHLRIYECPRLVSLPPSLFSLASLQNLIIESLENLTELPEEMGNLSMLSRLVIYDCPRLASLPPSLVGLTSLQTLIVSDCQNLVSLPPSLLGIISLRELKLAGSEKLIEFPEEMGNLSPLSALKIFNFPKLASIPPSLLSLTSLQGLQIGLLENLTELPEEMGNLSLLSWLEIDRCPRLVSLPPSLHGLTSLQSLTINECPELTSLPPSLLGLTSLQELRIIGCPHLERRYLEPNGEDCHLIKHIPCVKKTWW